MERTVRAGEYIIYQTENETYVFLTLWPKKKVSDREVEEAAKKAREVLDSVFSDDFETELSLKPLLISKAPLRQIFSYGNKRLCLVFETDQELEIYHLDSGEIEENSFRLKGALKRETVKSFLFRYLKKSVAEPIDHVSSEVSSFVEEVSQFRGHGLVRKASADGLVVVSAKESLVRIGLFLISNEWIISETHERRAKVRSLSSLEGTAFLGQKLLLSVKKDDLSFGEVKSALRLLLVDRREEELVSSAAAHKLQKEVPVFVYGEALKKGQRFRFEIRRISESLLQPQSFSLDRFSFQMKAYSTSVEAVSRALKRAVKKASDSFPEKPDLKSLREKTKRALIEEQLKSISKRKAVSKAL